MSFLERDMRLVRAYNPTPWMIGPPRDSFSITIYDSNGSEVCEVRSGPFASRTHQKRVANAIVEAVNKFLMEDTK